MPVTQFNMKWVEQAGLVKFDFLGLKTLTVLQTAVDAGQAARYRDRSRRAIPLDDKKTYELLARGGSGRRVPAGKRGHAARAASTCGPTASRTSSRWSRSTGPARWRTSRPTARASTGMERSGLPPPDARSRPEGNLRHHRLSGTGDADRAGPGRLLAGRRRPPAPRHGQEDQGGDGGAARVFVEGAIKNGIDKTRPTTSST